MNTFATQRIDNRQADKNTHYNRASGFSSPDVEPANEADTHIYRKSACSCGGGCPACLATSSAVKVSRSNDPAETEADQIADRVMRMSAYAGPAGIHSALEKNSIHPKRAPGAGDTGPAQDFNLAEVTSGAGGNALEQRTKNFMESRFQSDFSDVRIHTGNSASALNHELGARAFTLGSDVFFAAGQYAPGTVRGNHLIAHELTHTLQQKNSGGMYIQKQDDSIEVELVDTPYADALDLHNRGVDLPVVGTAPPLAQQNITHGSAWSLNGRRASNTKRASGFTGDNSGTHISHIDVQINPDSYSTASLRWANMGASPGYSLPASLNTSPGAGICSVDCSDVAQSQQSGSHCTPLSPPNYTVQGFSAHLGSYPSATFVTWYHYDRGIAFHYYAVPDHPESHGCTRLMHGENGAEWIYDNCLPGITTVTVNRNATQGPGPKCWRGEHLVSRPQPSAGP